jgi:hypothetical protein
VVTVSILHLDMTFLPMTALASFWFGRFRRPSDIVALDPRPFQGIQPGPTIGARPILCDQIAFQTAGMNS